MNYLSKASEFWNGDISVKPLCIYRIGFSLLIFLESLQWLPHTTELFSNQGFHIGFWENYAPSPALAFILCVILCISSFGILIGFHTKKSILITLVIRLYFYGIDQINEKTIYTVVMVMLAILFFSECSAFYSIDSIKRKKLGKVILTAPALPFRLLQLEIAHIYFFAAIVKMKNPDWVAGTVIIKIFEGRWASDLGIWLSGNAPVELFMAGGLATILVELLAGFLLFVPWARVWIITLALGMHLSIELGLKVEFIGLHFMWALLSLFPSEKRLNPTALAADLPSTDTSSEKKEPCL